MSDKGMGATEAEAWARYNARLLGLPVPQPAPTLHPDTGEPLPTGAPVPLPPTPGDPHA